jgi:hypothetical protein
MKIRKNDRPNKIINDFLYTYSPLGTPPSYASRRKWRKRGYKILQGARPNGQCEYWTGLKYCLFFLFSDIQVIEIGGAKAEERRKQAWD